MRRWGIELLILSVVIIWGINFTIAKYGLLEFTAIEFTALRMISAAPLMLLLTFFIEKSVYMERKDIPRLIIVSVVGIILYQTLFMETVKYTSATNASLLISISPIFTTVFAIFLKQEKFSSRKLVGSIIAFGGAALVLVAGHSLASSFYGNGIGLITSICWGLYPVLAGPLIKKIFSTTCYRMVSISWRDSAFIVKRAICIYNAISHYTRNDTIRFTIFHFLCNSIWFSDVVCWYSKNWRVTYDGIYVYNATCSCFICSYMGK